MKHIYILPSFERSLKKLGKPQKLALSESLLAFNRFVETGDAVRGLGIKKINHDKFEFRADIRLRVVFKETEAGYFLILVGNHDQVSRYLRDFRNK